MDLDNDIKIVGDKPSVDVKKNRLLSDAAAECTAEQINAAKALGKMVAVRFLEDAADNENPGEIDNCDMILQRRLLLSFTATVGFEKFCNSDMLDGIAQKSFLDTLKRNNSELYDASGDTGAFSFYYLAYRRGGEVERRIGQTFAMLCSHDGDPIFQELGEALYCWFMAEIKKCAEELGI